MQIRLFSTNFTRPGTTYDDKNVGSIALIKNSCRAHNSKGGEFDVYDLMLLFGSLYFRNILRTATLHFLSAWFRESTRSRVLSTPFAFRHFSEIYFLTIW